MPRFDAPRLAGLIDHIYEAGARPDLRRGVLAEISDALGAAGASVIGGPAAGLKILVSESLKESLDVGLRSGWLPDRNVPLARALNAFRQGHAIVTEQMVFTPWELEHLPFYAEFMAPLKLSAGAGMRLAGEGPASIALGVHRYIGSEPFSASSRFKAVRRCPVSCQGINELTI